MKTTKTIRDKYEYTSTSHLSDNNLTKFGSDGWELIQIYNGSAIFKRRVI